MSIVNKTWIKAFCILLCIWMMSVTQTSNAAMPRAGFSIGTKAAITYRDASNVLQKRESDIVLTTIAQVYQIEITPMRMPARAEKGENADIPFQVRNVGNGVDDVTFSVKNFPNQIDKMTFFSADSGGAVQVDTGIESSKSNPVPFTLKGVNSTNDQRYFVLRMPVPESAQNDDKFVADLGVTSRGGEIADIRAEALVIGRRPFSVVPGGRTKLRNDKSALVKFLVKGGLSTKDGYFQMWAVKSSDVSTPLKYKVGKRASFDGKQLLPGDFDSNDPTLFKMKREVGANGSYLIRMPIEIEDAERGDEIVVFIKYGTADPSGIKPISNEADLEKTTGFVIKFDHIEGMPVLNVVGNSGPGKGPDFTIIDQAIAGETVTYDLVLHNNSTFADTFTIEELTESKGELIAKVTPLDEKGKDEIRIGARGLPEIGPIPVGGQLNFKIAVRLRDGRISQTAQNAQFRFKAIRARSTDVIAQVLTVGEVVSGTGPIVTFSDADDMEASIHKLTLNDGADTKRFYMRVKNNEADNFVHEYKMKFVEDGLVIKSFRDQSCGSSVSNSGQIGAEGKVFCVDADLSGISRLTSEIIVTDSARASESRASITILKTPVVEFANTGYDSSGAPGGEAALTIKIVNRGGDMANNEFELWHDTADKESQTSNWSAVFSYDDKNWQTALALPAMGGGGNKDVFVKVAIPQDSSINRTWSVTLGLREIGETKSKASTVITFSLDESGLIILKEVAVVKSHPPTNCATGALPTDFAKVTDAKVKDGDCIWYRISVINLPEASLVHDVAISDPIPAHSSYTDGAKTNISDARPSFSLEKIVTQGVDLGPDASLVLTYPVTVNFKK
jgi:hypothetical protein